MRIETSQQELARLLRQASRAYLFHTGVKLFCAQCQHVERVVDAFPNLECKLACGCRWEIEPGLAQRIAKLEQEEQQYEQ